MTRYIVRRLLAALPTLLLLVFCVVLFARLTPSNVVDVILEGQARNDVTRHQLEVRLGLDRPVPIAYVQYIGNAVRGDLGHSLLTGESVRTLIARHIGVTIELTTYALLMGWIAGCVVGIVSAVRQDSPLDYALRSVAILGLTIPNFAVGTAVVILPTVYFHWRPPVIYHSFASDPVEHVKQLVVAAAVLSFGLAGGIMRIMRTQMLEVLRQDYMRTGRAKGLAGARLIWCHALKNAMIPVVSVFGLQMAVLVGGAVIVEQIFALPGIGTLLLTSVNQKDWPIVQGLTLVIGVWVILVNLAVDMSYLLFDPRTRQAVQR